MGTAAMWIGKAAMQAIIAAALGTHMFVGCHTPI